MVSLNYQYLRKKQTTKRVISFTQAKLLSVFTPQTVLELSL